MGMRLNSVQRLILVLLLVLAGVLSMELVNALGAQACSVVVYDGCYPWGAEGPAAGMWSYASKANYLLRGFGQLGLAIAAGSFLIWHSGRERALSGPERALLLLAAAGFILLFFV